MDGLRELGYDEGQTIAIEWCFERAGRDAPWAQLAAELAGVPVDVIVVESNLPAALAAKKATATIPIVAANANYPVETGLVASLARSGGNVTCVTPIASGEIPKHVELLRDVVPGAGSRGDLGRPGQSQARRS